MPCGTACGILNSGTEEGLADDALGQTRSIRATISRILSGLPAMMRPRNRTPNLPAESSSSGTNAVPAVGRRLSLAPPSFLLGANARRRSSVGQRRQLSRRVPRSTSLGARRASRARRRSSIFQSSYMEPPVHPIIMREIPDEELEEEEEESNKKEPKTTHPLRRLSRILSGAGPAFARRVSQLRRKSVALVEGGEYII